MRNKSAIHLCIIAGLILLAVQLGLLAILLYPYNSEDSFPVEDVAAIVNISSKLHIPLLMFEENILQQYLSSKYRSKKCILCRQSYSLNFGAFFQGIKQTENSLNVFRSAGFEAFLLYNIEPAIVAPSLPANVPICYVLKKKIIVYIAIIYEREGNFWWHGAISSDPNADTVLSSVGSSVYQVQFMEHEGAFEKFEVEHAYIDGLQFLVPKDIPQFRRELAGSKFIECNHLRAEAFHRQYGKDKTHEALKFTHKAWKLLSRAKTLLDNLGVPFWLSSGTCLGYFRQCSIIPYSKDVDIGVFIKDFNEKIVPEFSSHGFALKHWFGRVNDSLELTFISGDLKLDIFFFYEEGHSMWNGGTQAKSGKKFKYVFPRFTLCWTEFLELKVRVPCELNSYIEANYGPDWFIPVTQWDWKSSPPNVVENGVWPAEEWPQVIRMYN